MADATTARSEKRARRDAYVAAHNEARRRLKAEGIEAAVELLDSPWSGVRAMAVRALRENGWAGEALPTLVERAAREDDDSVRMSIGLALRDLEDPCATDTLWQLFETAGSEELRWGPLQGLSRLGDERVIPILVSWYETDGWSFTARARRSLAVFDLALMRTESGDRALADLIASEKSWLRRVSIRRQVRRAERWLSQSSRRV
jgi:HEAT repeat protein